MLSILVLSLGLVATGDVMVIHAVSSPRDVEVRLELGREGAARLRKSTDKFPDVLTLSVETDRGEVGRPIFANYSLRGDRLVLRPRYRLTPGVTYVAKTRLPDGTSLEKRYRVPEPPAGPAPRVQQVFPSSATLPANCLKFYIHFSRPMRQGRKIFEQIQLADEQGNVLRDPWRRTELWNAEGNRLTMWIHPGRIKQGVNLREDFGPVLKPNRRYRLVVTAQVCDLEGLPLATPHVKEFVTAAEDHQRPDLRRWKLNSVHSGSRDPLVAVLDEPLDRALLLRFVTVTTGTTAVPGSVVINDAETKWTFTPARPWPAAPLRLNVHDRLEDLAGNTPRRLFDTDLTRDPLVEPTLQIPITRLPRPATQ